jgi:hypothetical protein
VDFVGEEGYTDVKTDEVYRLSDLSIKSEYEVSILLKCFCGVYLCVCFVPCCVWVDSFMCIKQPFLVCSGEELNCQDVDMYDRLYVTPWPVGPLGRSISNMWIDVELTRL